MAVAVVEAVLQPQPLKCQLAKRAVEEVMLGGECLPQSSEIARSSQSETVAMVVQPAIAVVLVALLPWVLLSQLLEEQAVA